MIKLTKRQKKAIIKSLRRFQAHHFINIDDKNVFMCDGDGSLVTNNITKYRCFCHKPHEIICPPNLKILDLSDSNHRVLPKLPESLRILKINNTYIDYLPEDLPNGIIYINCRESPFRKIKHLPANLRYLNCAKNGIMQLPKNMPTNLIKLECEYNRLKKLPLLPKTLHFLDCSKNKIKSIKNIPPNLRFLNCSRNKISSLPNLPTSLKTFGYDFHTFNPPFVIPKYINRIYSEIDDIKNDSEIPNIATLFEDHEPPQPREDLFALAWSTY